MVFLKWLGLALADLILLPIYYCLVPFVSLFTRDGWPWWLIWASTYDSEPQGDRGWIRARSYFPGELDGWKGYLNRCGWLWRNPLYQFSKFASIPFSKANMLFYKGDDKPSDKYKRPGRYWATVYDKQDNLIAFEFYMVKPWPFKVFGREICLRTRLGWKVYTDKFEKLGFAPLVNTFNPFDGYGDQ